MAELCLGGKSASGAYGRLVLSGAFGVLPGSILLDFFVFLSSFNVGSD